MLGQSHPGTTLCMHWCSSTRSCGKCHPTSTSPRPRRAWGSSCWEAREGLSGASQKLTNPQPWGRRITKGFLPFVKPRAQRALISGRGGPRRSLPSSSGPNNPPSLPERTRTCALRTTEEPAQAGRHSDCAHRCRQHSGGRRYLPGIGVKPPASLFLWLRDQRVFLASFVPKRDPDTEVPAQV